MREKDEDFEGILEKLRAAAPPPEQEVKVSEKLRDREKREAQPPVDYEFSKSVQNVPANAVEYATDISALLFDPYTVANGMVSLMSGAGQKYMPDATKNVVNFFKGRDPLAQDKETYEIIANEMKNRYGTVDGFKKYAMERPVEALADISTVLAAPLTLGKQAANVSKMPRLAKTLAAAEKAALSVDPVNLVPSTVAAVPKVQDYASGLYRRGLRYPASAGSKRAAEVSQFGYENSIRPNQAGVEKLGKIKDELITTRQGIIDDMPDRIPVDELYTPAKGLRKTRSRTTGTGTPDADVAAIDDVIQTHSGATRRDFGNKLRPQQVEDIKEAVYQQIGNAYNPNAGLLPAQTDAYKAIARGGKEALERRSPEISDVNRQLGDAKELDAFIDPQSVTLEGRPHVGLNYPAQRIGTVASNSQKVGAIVGFLAETVSRSKLETALLLKRAAKNTASWQAVRQVLQEAGFTGDEIAALHADVTAD